MNPQVFIIDDEVQICESIKLILDYEGYGVDYVNTGEAGIERLRLKDYDVLIVDIQLPGINGFEVLQQVKEINPLLNILVISAFSNIENAVKATKLGAFDFIEKPIDRDKLLISVRNAYKQSSLLKENTEMRKAIGEDGNIIGRSPSFKKVLDTVESVAPTDARVLITGENGTGKEIIAKAIHEKSQRQKFSFE